MKHDLPLIGLVGYIGSGKNTAANYLASKYGYKVTAFAEPIYEQLAALNPRIVPEAWVNAHYNDLVTLYGVDYVKRNFPGVRLYLQRLGDECGRRIHGEDCWIRIYDRKYGKEPLAAIADVRYTNEIAYIRSRGGIILHVDNGNPREFADHNSETLNCEAVRDHLVLNISTESMQQDIDNIIAYWVNE